MSNVGPEWRSFEPITVEDLRRLLDIAKADREDLFKRRPRWACFEERVLCVALCQGAAKHFVDGTTGINDFDVYTFYRDHPEQRWCDKRIKRHDFGNPKFGKSKNCESYQGRRVDCMGRAIDVKDDEKPAQAILRYLTEARTETAKCLKEKAVVMLEPDCGTKVWPS